MVDNLKIIIEGPDCCGKTYLIHRLKHLRTFKDFEVEHLSGYTPNTKEFHEDLLNYDKPMIFDRFFVGETIYPKIFNREPKMTEDDMYDLINKYKSKIVIIFIDADYDFIISAHRKKNEEFDYNSTKEIKRMFNERYESLKNVDGLKVFKFKNFKENKKEFEDFIKFIKKELKKCEL